jgi:integrase
MVATLKRVQQPAPRSRQIATDERPLLDALAVRRGLRKGERYANVRQAVRERLKLLGRERAPIYKTMVLSGLRKNELASLTVGQLHLDGPLPFAELEAADEKNREGNGIPIRSDLASDLSRWLTDRLALSRLFAISGFQALRILRRLLPLNKVSTALTALLAYPNHGRF